jgi:uncharacterized protein YbjQ (UPF0145 family)
MKGKLILAMILALAWAAGNDAQARDTRYKFPVQAVLDNPEYARRLSGVTFYFGDSAHPAIVEDFGEYRSNRKTNAVGKSDREACEWAFLSALLSFRDRAISLGANAVVNISSNYRDLPFKSDTEFECGAGGLMAGSALIGTVVSVKAD